MQKLSIKRVIEFRGKSDKSKVTFAAAIKKDKKQIEVEGGGNYWITSISAISNAFKANDLADILDKKIELEGKYNDAELTITKTMYKRNISILSGYEDHDFKKSRPPKKVTFLNKPKGHSVLTVKDFQLQASPNHVFTFERDSEEEIGAVWFVAQLGGLKKEELGMYTDILYRYLKTRFPKGHTLSQKYCVAIDVINRIEVNYAQLEKGEVAAILSRTLEEIRKLM